MNCFERANLPNLSEEERKKSLHFVVICGGPTGVEFFAMLHDFVQEDFSKLYHNALELVKISLIEAGEHILNMFDTKITQFTKEKFQWDGIDVKTNINVVKVHGDSITMTNSSMGEVNIPYGMAIWSTGFGTRLIILGFMKKIDQGNMCVLETVEWLRVLGCGEAFTTHSFHHSPVRQRTVILSHSPSVGREPFVLSHSPSVGREPFVLSHSPSVGREPFVLSHSPSVGREPFVLSHSPSVGREPDLLDRSSHKNLEGRKKRVK
ncbi:NAD(P)H dehydrogenase B1, mitochondrial [Dendrobium catenatum]|uniref:NADH:ubiquinone reductase (non-electrogenic) n=1 Tax=Dendrobium catenatum TaxID=906689 RepID=A0A2I0WM90_9ASPA|nr:NAD(P)H dehydrogenase B1, mitochondrial [Dendrobium catenatum]